MTEMEIGGYRNGVWTALTKKRFVFCKDCIQYWYSTITRTGVSEMDGDGRAFLRLLNEYDIDYRVTEASNGHVIVRVVDGEKYIFIKMVIEGDRSWLQ